MDKPKTMKLAVRKETGEIPGSGFHYFLLPIKLESDFQAAAFEQMGHIIIEVDADKAEALLDQARLALRHQIEIAHLAEAARVDRSKVEIRVSGTPISTRQS